ncbi:MAG: HAMP domain-containing histidine kinase [Cyclobacteriaceae bacterium]|nr:HAMP domain-containing histidine kinase [Cyclobacteriaceae bacterium]
MKLLNRTIKNYLQYSILLVLSCTPLFYFSIKYLIEHDRDDELIAHKRDFSQSLAYINTKESIEFYRLMNKEFTLVPVEVLPANDSLFTQGRYDSSAAAVVPHRIFRTGVTVDGRNYELQIKESLLNSTRLIGAIMSIQLLMLGLLVGGLIFINRRLTKTVWGPFYLILDRLKKYKIDQGNALELPPSSTAEFRDLGLVLMQLVQKSQETFFSQKEFTENASHELQTPLAICKSKLELLAQTKELTEEQAELVGSLFDALDRITRLNKNLLLLSKIENRQFFDLEKIELASLIDKSIETYRRQAEEKRLRIKIDIVQPLLLTANPILLEVLASNLISNAIRHTPESGSVTIEVSASQLKVNNSGPPLEQPDKIFQRFHRESKTTLGSGLGMSIIKKICDVSGFRIEYSYINTTHCFTIQFQN